MLSRRGRPPGITTGSPPRREKTSARLGEGVTTVTLRLRRPQPLGRDFIPGIGHYGTASGTSQQPLAFELPQVLADGDDRHAVEGLRELLDPDGALPAQDVEDAGTALRAKQAMPGRLGRPSLG